ncbi:MAG TPA: hypothetical protein VFG54_22505 [Prolixibacteraceae bacterium]|nr:hypothetical protein [Prolixibacteraceae bacterium]
MKDCYLGVLLFNPLAWFSGHETDPEKLQLLRIITILSLILTLFIVREVWKFSRKRQFYRGFFRQMIRRVRLDVTLEKDKVYRPRVLTMTIRNIGKRDADLNAPVIEFRKIWTKRKFKVNGANGRQIYPLFLYPGNAHQLEIETASFHQYDRSIKGFYWACIHVSDSQGRRWKSNRVKLRKSLVT